MKCDCQWEGTVATLEEHESECEYSLVPCPKECKNSENEAVKVIRNNIDHHLIHDCYNREYSCQHCGLEGTYATTLNHYNTCSKYVTTCTNEECTMGMQRMMIKEHLENECDYTVISCKYDNIECDLKLKRIEMRVHEEDHKTHLIKALEIIVKLEHTIIGLEHNIVDLKDTVVKLKDGMDNLIEKKYVLGNGECMTFKVTDIQRKRDNDEKYVSPLFYTSEKGYHMKIQVHPNGYGDFKGSHVSVFAHVLKGKYDDKLNWPLLGTVTLDLLNQLEDKNHRTEVGHFTQETNVTVGYGRGYYEFIPHSELSCDSSTQYLKDDTLYFRVSVDVLEYKPWLQCTT